jgi:hypothetical protein
VGVSTWLVLVRSGNTTAFTMVLLCCPAVIPHNTADAVELHICHSNIVSCIVIIVEGVIKFIYIWLRLKSQIYNDVNIL